MLKIITNCILDLYTIGFDANWTPMEALKRMRRRLPYVLFCLCGVVNTASAHIAIPDRVLPPSTCKPEPRLGCYCCISTLIRSRSFTTQRRHVTCSLCILRIGGTTQLHITIIAKLFQSARHHDVRARAVCCSGSKFIIALPGLSGTLRGQEHPGMVTAGWRMPVTENRPNQRTRTSRNRITHYLSARTPLSISSCAFHL